MLKLFDKYNIKTTWFIPGHSLETFPDECRAIVEAGHEIGLHGYSHENPIAMTLEQQTAIMDKCYKLIMEFTGKKPRGIVAPWWESSKEGAELMLRCVLLSFAFFFRFFLTGLPELMRVNGGGNRGGTLQWWGSGKGSSF